MPPKKCNRPPHKCAHMVVESSSDDDNIDSAQTTGPASPLLQSFSIPDTFYNKADQLAKMILDCDLQQHRAWCDKKLTEAIQLWAKKDWFIAEKEHLVAEEVNLQVQQALQQALEAQKSDAAKFKMHCQLKMTQPPLQNELSPVYSIWSKCGPTHHLQNPHSFITLLEWLGF